MILPPIPALSLRRLLALLLCACAALGADARAQAGSVHTISGNAAGLAAGGQKLDLRPGLQFDVGARFETLADDALELALTGGCTLVLAPDTVVRVERRGSGVGLTLLRGAIQLRCDASAVALQVAVSGGLVGLPGGRATQLTLAIEPPPAAAGALSVARGEAGFTPPAGGVQRITAGQTLRWDAQAGVRPTPRAALPASLQALLSAADAAADQLFIAALPASAAGAPAAPPSPVLSLPPLATGVAPPGGGGCVGSGC